ncbi:MAG: HAD family phosphatase [Candidatus Sungbacteria bacterium]|nr:HAD family phosphatase [Candidatus Sungbacteria bacterium]
MQKAVIFDMDGVIADTQIIHASVASNMLRDVGIVVDPDIISYKYAGVSYPTMFREIFDQSGIQKGVEEIVAKTRSTALKALQETEIVPLPGALELIQICLENGFATAIASSSRFAMIDTVLNKLGLTGKFHAIASGEEVKRGKPDPEIFLLAAQRISINPQNCVVIEDSYHGMFGAKSAGMKCIGLIRDGDFDRGYPADLLVKNLHEVSVGTILDILGQ